MWSLWYLTAFLLLFCAPHAQSQAPSLLRTWARQSPVTNPPARYIHALTYDSQHGQTVMFGGFGGGGYLNDTWTWDGTTWTQRAPGASPSPRAAHAMAYDAARGKVVMFGGLASVNTRLNDTWLWDGANWTQATPANSPSPRAAGVMVYDAAHSQVVMFGGNNSQNLGDTWIWDGTTWTQANPLNSPSARADYSMVYDAARGRVVLFGGQDSYGTFLNDTWTWDGANWTQASPAFQPPARYAQGMAYDAASGQTLMWGGYNGGFLNDTWAWDGTNWTLQTEGQTVPAGRYAPNAISYDAAREQVVLFAGYGSAGQSNDTWTWALPGNFGRVCVGPCATQSAILTYSVPASTSFGSVQAVTNGAAGLDFSAQGGSCNGTIQAGGTCFVQIGFKPQAAGLRPGAVQLFDSGANLLTNTPVFGIGTTAETAFDTASRSIIDTGAFFLYQPKGVAVDAVGEVFIANTYYSQVLKVARDGTVTTVGTGLQYPQGLAVDGAGNLFIADNNLNKVVEVPAGCASSGCQRVWGASLRSQLGTAVDGAGNLFVGDFLDGIVEKISTTTGAATIVYQPGPGSNPVGLAVDAAGDLYVADFGRHAVVEVPAGCTSTNCQISIGTGWNQPESVSVDPAGNVYVTDAANGTVVEVPAGCSSGACQITLSSGVETYGAAVDGAGNLFIADLYNSRILKLNRSQAPSLTFSPVEVGGTSADSPQSFTIQNVGNSPLVFYGNGVGPFDTNFPRVSGPGSPADCSSVSLAAGAVCNVSIRFTPQSAGNPLLSHIDISDNVLNAPSSSPAVQSVALSGVGIVVTPTSYTLAVSGLGTGTGLVSSDSGGIGCNIASQSSLGTCSASFVAGAIVKLTATAAQGSTFAGWGGDCANNGLSSVCLVLMNSAMNATANFVQTSFGNVNVCPSGQSSPAPCSGSLSLTFTMAQNTTMGATQVVTQGAAGLDFKIGNQNTCTGIIAAGSSCGLNVTFSPLAPGLRLGAVRLFDDSGNLVGSAYISGIGQSPAAAFGAGTLSVVNTGAFNLSAPLGLALDAAGNLFVADPGTSQVIKINANGGQTTAGSGLVYPQGLAIDGAGNLFIADKSQNQVVEVPAGCSTSACQIVLASNLRSQLGVAVNGRGDVFVGDYLDGQVVKISATDGAQTVVYNPGAGSNPVGLAVNAAGDLLIADFGRKAVIRVPDGCVDSSCQTTVGSGWSQPDSVATDAAGDVYVADAGLQSVVEVPAGCTNTACQTVLLSGVATAAAIADGTGNVFVADSQNKLVFKLNRSLPPTVAFGTAVVGSSASSPQTVPVQNTGNQSLTGSVSLNLGSNFTELATCTTAFPLAPGATCNETFGFSPQAAGYFAGTATFSDNTGNLSPLVVLQTIKLTGAATLTGQPPLIAVPNVVGMTKDAAVVAITAAGLAVGPVSTAASSTMPAGNVTDSNPSAGSAVAVGSAVKVLLSSGQPQAAVPNPLLLQNNYFVTGDYYAAGVTLRGTGQNGFATGTITIPSSAAGGTQGVPDGADILAAYLYWETLENTPSASGASARFRGYAITGQQIGSDSPYTDGALSGTMRVYRTDVNAYLPAGANGVRLASGAHSISMPDGGGAALPLTEGASLVIIYRVLSPNFPLKAVVVYDGSAVPTTANTQLMQGFYDAVGGAGGSGNLTALFASGGTWNTSSSSPSLGSPSQFTANLNPGSAYAALVLSTPVNNSDNDAILDAWKAGPPTADFHEGQPGYYDVKTGGWVGLPGAKHGQKDLFVQLDYMCGAVLTDGSCDPTQENLFPAPDAQGNDPLQMVQKAFAAHGVQLHLQIGNIVPEDTCTDNPGATPPQLCQFPNQSGVISWKNSLMFSKLWPRNLLGCLTGGDCTTRFPYGQKDSYHYVLFGHSLAIPAWNARFGTLTSIQVRSNVATIVTADRGTGINACPSRITLSGVLGNSALNGIYNTTSCPDSRTILVSTPGVPDWTFPNSTLPEPLIGLTSGTVTSISGYSDLGGADSAVTLGLWATAPHQDMSKRANVTAGTLFHEIGHTLGLSHGGLYYDTPGTYVPTFDANCKPNYQSVMNYLFQLDLVGPARTLDFSNQVLNPLDETAAGAVTQLTDSLGHAATFPTSAWYAPLTPGITASAATRHCDGSPLSGDSAYRVDGPIQPITPAWANGQDINFDGQVNTRMRGYDDWAGMDLRQVGATGGQFAALAPLLSFSAISSSLNVAAGGNVTLGSGGTVTLGSGGNVTLGSGGNVTLGSGGTITLGSGGNVTLGSGGNVTLGSGGTITLGSGGNVTLGSGGNVTLGSGGTITLGSGGVVTIPSSGGTYTLPAGGGTITLGSGGNVTLGSGGNVTLGSGGTITLGSGGNVTLGSGGNVTLGSGGTITLGSGGNVTLGSGGNVTLGSGGTITLGSGGTITLGSGGNVTLGSGGTVTLGSGGAGAGGNVTLGSGGNVTLGSGGTITLGSGGNVTLGSGGNVTLGSGGTITLGSGGNVTLGSGGNVTLGSGGTITLGSGGNVTLGSGGNVTLGSGGTITLGSGGVIVIPAGGSYTLPAGGGTITLGSGGNVTLGSGGNVTLGSGGTITLGSGGNVTLGSGGNVTLGSGGTITLGSGGTITLGSGGNVTLGSGGNVTLGSGGNVTLGSGGNVTLGSGGLVALGSGGNVTLGSGGNVTLGSGGVNATELTYEDANSVARPPSSPTETPGTAGVRIDWTAPAFGVVERYTIYRSSDGAPAVAIGSVSGVNGNPPVTSFIDENPDLSAKVVVYTISTMLVPDTTGAQPRQSLPSAPAVLKNDQSIALSPLPSSVVITDPPPVVTATAQTSGVPNGLQVNFVATGSCSIGSQSLANNISSATVALTGTGPCKITASQSGTDTFNPANSVSGVFTVLPQGSSIQSQKISFATLANVQYGDIFTLSAMASSGLPVSFQAAGPCTTGGATTGVGLCTITASAPANSTYSAAAAAQSFLVLPAVLRVTADNLVSVYGQPLPSFTFKYSGFVKNENASAVFGAPALSTTAGAGSNAGSYPIVVSTGSLAATNYSFLYVNGVLTIQPVAQRITFNVNAPATAAYNSSFTVAATGGASGNPVVFTSSGACRNSGATFTMTNSVGTCLVIANQLGNTNFAAAPQVAQTVTATGPQITLSSTSLDFGTVYLGSLTSKTITVRNTGTAPVAIKDPVFSVVRGGNSNEFVALNLCPKSLPAAGSCTIRITFLAGPFYTPQTASLQIVDDAPFSPQTVALTATVINPLPRFSAEEVDFGRVKVGTSKTATLTLRNAGTTPVLFNGVPISITGANATAFKQSNNCPPSLAPGAACTVQVTFTPSAKDSFKAELTDVDNSQNCCGKHVVELEGEGSDHNSNGRGDESDGHGDEHGRHSGGHEDHDHDR